MDPNVYLNKLSEAEQEVEYLVRGLTVKARDSRKILINCLESEVLDELLKPKDSHIRDNPNVEIQLCINSYEEISKATSERGISPSDDFVIGGLAKTIHYKERIKRLIHSFGDHHNLSNIHSNIRRIYNSLFKLYQERVALGAQVAPRIRSPKTINTTSSPHVQQDRDININTGKYQTQDRTLGTRSQILLNEGKELRESVADFFNKIDSNRANQEHFQQSLEFSSRNLEQERSINRANQMAGNYRNIPERVVRNPDDAVPISQVRMDQLYKIKQRWNLSFDGTDANNVHDFTYRLEQMAKDDGYPKDALTRVLHLFLSKKAEDWYWIFKVDNPGASWQTMKSAMISYFSSFDFEEEIREQILRRYQGNKEKFSDYALSVQKLNARLPNRLSEKEILYRLSQNMLPALRNVTLPAQNLIRTVEELRVLCQRYERMWDQTGYDPRQFSDGQYRRRQINELCHEFHQTSFGSRSRGGHQENRFSCSNESDDRRPVYEGSHSLEAFHKFNNRASKPNDQSGLLVCWNCKDLGHRYQDCKQEFLNIFCFGCGTPNVRKPNCTNCLKFSTENIRPGVNVSRPTHWGKTRVLRETFEKRTIGTVPFKTNHSNTFNKFQLN